MAKWEDYKLFYRQYFKTYQFKYKLNNAIEKINEFPNKSGLKINEIYSTCSAGKDSTVLSILVNEQFPGIKIFSEKDNYDFPNEKEYLNYLKNKFNWNIDIIQVFFNIKKYNIFEEIHSKSSKLSKENFYNIIKEYKKNNNFRGVYLGLRTEESKARRINFNKNGYIYKKTDNEWICNPLSNWKGKDIFACLEYYNIEPFEVYKKIKFCHPEKIRKGWYLPGSRSNRGICLWLKYYYPELYQKLENEFSMIRRFT